MAFSSRIVLATALLSLVSACGGGGGDGGGSSVPAGAFTLSRNAVSFSAKQNGAAPAAATVSMTITGSRVAYVGAAYTNGQTQPSWLGIDITGSGNAYTVSISVTTAGLSPGDYTSNFSVGTADSNGNVLQSQAISVTYAVRSNIGVSTPAASYSMTYGSNIATLPHSVNVSAPDRQWRATSDSAWLRVPDTTQSGSGPLQATVDPATLEPGTYQARLTVTNTADAQDTATQTVQLTLLAPTLVLSRASLLLGGEDGLGAPEAELGFSIGTGTAAHPYTIALVTDSGTAWLASSSTAGQVAAAGTSVQITADPGAVAAGTHTAQLRVTATVRNLVLTELIPVTYQLEASRLVVGAAGVAFSSSPAPARSVLARDVKVHSSIERTDVPWQASSNRSWLGVTASGVTGGALRLQANPSGLAAGQTHFATVTITSPDARVENSQTIRVGLRVNAVAPADFSLVRNALFVAASPVEPIVFVNAGGPTVSGLNVYTGAEERTFTGNVANAGAMVLSDDGARLFVYDRTNLRVTELDATTGAFVRHYAAQSDNGTTPAGGGLAYLRPSGHPFLITPSSSLVDLTTLESTIDPNYGAPLSAYSLHVSGDSRYVTNESGSVHRFHHSALAGGRLDIDFEFAASTAQGRTGQACINADQTLVYTASGAPYEFPGTSFVTHQVAQILPGTNYPNSMLCLWNGVVIGGVDGYYAPADVWVYDGRTGVELTRRSSSQLGDYRSLLERGMATSGDTTRLVTLTNNNYSVPGAQEIRIQSIPGTP